MRLLVENEKKAVLFIWSHRLMYRSYEMAEGKVKDKSLIVWAY